MITLQMDMNSLESFTLILRSHVTTLAKVLKYLTQSATSEVYKFIYQSISLLPNLFERKEERQGQEEREKRWERNNQYNLWLRTR